MKKTILLLLAALLLCGLFACKPTDPTEETEATPAPSEPAAQEQAQTAAPDQTEGPVFSEENARPVTFSEDADTVWHSSNAHLMLYNDETGILNLRWESYEDILWVTEQEGAFHLELPVFRTEFDPDPAYHFPAGTLRLLTDGASVKVEVSEDPLGVLTCAGLDGELLAKYDRKPYRYIFSNWGNTPSEPNTEWSAHFQNSHQTFRIDENAAFCGAVRMPDGTDHACVIMSNQNSYAVVEEHDGTAELLFYGERETADDWRTYLAQLRIRPVYDPYDLCGGEALELYRDEEHLDELCYMNGQNLDTVILRLMRDGWTDETDHLIEIAPFLEGWFDLLRKNGETLLIFYELDFTPYGDEAFPIGFVQYDADGKVLAWSGVKPIDHAIADAYTVSDGSAFHNVVGWGGMIFNEDDFIYFLDDGRIAVQTVWHENRDEDCEFAVYRVIP